jgi:putative ABC transport system permease protein
MRIADEFAMSAGALAANPVRTALTMLGIIFGVGCMICMAAIGAGAEARVAAQIRAFGANVLLVNPAVAKREAQHGGGARRSLTSADARAIEALPLVSAAAPSVFGSVQVVRGNRHWGTTLNGTLADHFDIREWRLKSGRMFSEQDERDAGKVVILASVVAEKLFEGNEPVGETVRILDTPFSVIGVLDEKGASGGGQSQDDVIFVPLSTATTRLIGAANKIDREAVAYILASATSEEAVPDALDAIGSLLRQRHAVAAGQDDDFTVTSAASALAAQRESTRTMAILLASIAAVALLVGGIGIMNVMLVCVTERTAEIGLRLAIGARPRDVRRQFLVEAVVICTIGGIIGAACGSAAAWTVAGWFGWPVLIQPSAAALAVAVAGGVGVFFGYYPAKRASALEPVVALRRL